MSRNQREGHYYGWVKGRHIRQDRTRRDKWGVSSWYAFRVFTQRPTDQPAIAARKENA